ncbi:MAG: translation initiation factor [Flavipsychrobacter sp.]|jgi:translation initiation factor IF-2|nr:translation initiation factor [Flavipsychrobacter sp.]
MTPTKTPRLGEAIKEFNVGRETLVEFLLDKGFDIKNPNPGTKLTEQMYNALQVEFAPDKAAKRKSEAIALPKGSLLDGIRKTKEDLDITGKDKKDEAPAVVEKPKAKEEKPKEAEKPKAVEAKEEPKKAAVKEEVTPKKTAAKEEEPAETKKTAAKAEDKPKTKAKAEKEEAEAPEHLDVKAPKIEGPNILGKINLEDMNLASRPKKGAVAKKKETTKKEDKPEGKTKAKKEVAEVPEPVIEPEVVTPEPEQDDEQGKPEHIEMKAPKLEGPKIIGRIELPVAQPPGSGRPDNRSDANEKRKRKRIPVEKKPETHKPDQGQQPTGRDGGFNRDNRGGGQGGGGFNRDNRGGQGGGGFNRDNRGGQGGGGFNRGGQGGGGFNRGGQGGGGGFRQGDRRGAPRNEPISAQQQEIDTKAIQDKIRETQAKLTGSTRSKNLKAKYRRNKRDEMADKRAAAENAEQGNSIQVTEFISVSELASMLNVSFAEVISKCMSLGIMVSINQRLDAEVIELVSSEFGFDVEFINLEQEADEEIEEVDAEEDLKPRAPIVTIMGHVDHGKTSLLDYIRSANVVAGEAGGITQHIGAYQVKTATGKRITFLDTPGHEAFTAMRARGAKVADVAVIVVAADDAIMPQTKEAISHAQAANLPMIFAINKIDKEGANPEKIKEQLANMNILVEDWGGKFQSQEISAKKGTNVDLLLEKIGLEAELLELKANPDRSATGSVIEASLDKGRGYQSTILVQNGTLHQGDMIACGQYYGKIKAMFNERGQRVQEAGPSAPVQILGLNGAPQAGEKFRMFEDEDEAKELANHRAQILREQGIRARKHITLDEIGRRLALGNFKELGVIIKGDFDGSVEALSDSLQKLSTEEVAINVVHKGVGQITESDVLLATASDAIIIGFQVRPSMQASKLATQENIEIRTYSIIYDAIDEIKSAMEGLLEPKLEKKTVANIEVREIYKISGVGTIAGCYVLDGKMTRQTKLNIVRDGIVVYTGELSSLKRFKDDVKEVNAGYECGLMVKNYNDLRVGDIIEGFDEVEVKRTL